MKIIIDEQSISWYRDELDLNNGDSIRFFPRYGGYSPIQSGFSLGISPEPVKEGKVLTEAGGLSFFVRKRIYGILTVMTLRLSSMRRKQNRYSTTINNQAK